METTTLTLAEFLLARIAEDEADAQSTQRDIDKWHREREGTGRADGSQGSITLTGIFGTACDPARVLAECEAKRRIVALHRLAEGPTYRGTPCCARCTADGEYPADDAYTDEQNWPCPTLRLLALPYAAHPDYREEWRP